MIYLLLTILVSSFIYVTFKYFDRFKVNTFQAILVNYLICATLAIVFSGTRSIDQFITEVKPSLLYSISLSVLFIVVFNFVGLTSQKFGVTITSLADRINLVIPVAFAFLFFSEQVTLMKLIGIFLALIAIVLAVSKPEEEIDENRGKFWYYPLIIFFGGGLVGAVMKGAQYNFPDLNFNSFLIVSFLLSFFMGSVYLIIQLIKGEAKFESKSIIAGLILGIPNYLSLYVFLKALDTPNLDSSIIFPINNIAIIVLSSILGIFLFQERLSLKNWLGVGLSILSIVLLLIETIHV